MQHLVNAFLIHRVPRFVIIGKCLFDVGDKYYFENLGIRHALWGYRIEDKGKILENAVYNQLLFLGYRVKVGVLGVHEIDFVAEKKGENSICKLHCLSMTKKSWKENLETLVELAIIIEKR